MIQFRAFPVRKLAARATLPRARSIITPAMSSNGNDPSSTSQIKTQPEIVSTRRTHTSTKDRMRLGSSLIVSIFKFHLSVRCEAPRCGVELNVNSLRSSSRDRRTVIPEL